MRVTATILCVCGRGGGDWLAFHGIMMSILVGTVAEAAAVDSQDVLLIKQCN